LGRHHDLVVTGGENVYPAEVESEIERISGVRAACVFGIPYETWGEIVCVAVVREAGVEVSPKDLSAHVVKKLASHKRPRRVAFLDELPMTGSGKVDRRRVREIASPLLAEIPKHG
ncbi:MAG: AMP-binding enzyme, partial [Polyangiaceae bacterium]